MIDSDTLQKRSKGLEKQKLKLEKVIEKRKNKLENPKYRKNAPKEQQKKIKNRFVREIMMCFCFLKNVYVYVFLFRKNQMKIYEEELTKVIDSITLIEKLRSNQK